MREADQRGSGGDRVLERGGGMDGDRFAHPDVRMRLPAERALAVAERALFVAERALAVAERALFVAERAPAPATRAPGPATRAPGPSTRAPGQAKRAQAVATGALLSFATLALAGCGVGNGSVPDAASAPGACVPAGEAVALPDEVRESSGVAFSLRFPGVLWTHNDSGWRPFVYAVTRSGMLDGTLRVEGVAARDWEAMDVTPCDAGSCIWIADTGDNGERRSDVELVRIPETEPGEGTPVQGERFPIVLPDGPRDIEAMYILPGERIHLVTKGRNHPVTVYRYPLPLRPGQAVVLEEVQELFPGIPSFRNRVTGASASADGSVVLVRSYDLLHFFRPDPADGTLLPMGVEAVNLRPLQEPQGEAVAIGSGGEVVLTSEGGPLRRAPVMNFLTCGVLTGG